MTITHVNVLPTAIFVLMPSTFLITYMIAVSLDHVPAEFPYISDTGSFSPESCIFSQLLNIIAILFFIFIWVRYAQVKTIFGGQLEFAHILCLNKVSFWFGTLSSIGISLVSNFQETNLIVIHVLGALLCFFPGMIYITMQSVVSYRTTLCTKTVATLRITLTVFGTLTLLVLMISTPISLALFHGKSMQQWKPEDGGFVYHAISTISEWVLTAGFCVYVLTFSTEFRDLRIEPPQVLMQRAFQKYVPVFPVHVNLELLNTPISETSQPTDDGYLPEAELYRPIVVQTEPYRELLA